MAMTEKQKRFANEYLIDLNATRAYKEAYPSCKNENVAAASASKLLRNPKVAEYVEKRQSELRQKTEITQERVLQELANIAFSNATQTAKVVEMELPEQDDEGNLTGKVKLYKIVDVETTESLDKKKKSAIAGIEQTQAGIKIKQYDKLKALELLGKHLELFNEKKELKLSGSVSVEELIKKVEGSEY